nr:uncharacterized protein LOC114820581 [Malus domestica]
MEFEKPFAFPWIWVFLRFLHCPKLAAWIKLGFSLSRDCCSVLRRPSLFVAEKLRLQVFSDFPISLPKKKKKKKLRRPAFCEQGELTPVSSNLAGLSSFKYGSFCI